MQVKYSRHGLLYFYQNQKSHAIKKSVIIFFIVAILRKIVIFLKKKKNLKEYSPVYLTLSFKQVPYTY